MFGFDFKNKKGILKYLDLCEIRNGNRKDVVTYSKTMSDELLKKNIIKILLYGLEIILWITVVKLYANFGVKWIVPSVSAMWVCGAITAFFVKEEQENTVKSTKLSIAGYLLFLLLYRLIIGKISGISAEEFALSLGINVTQAAGIAIGSWLQNILKEYFHGRKIYIITMNHSK